MPRKEFEAFTRLDASDVNTFLMDQSVMSFAGTATRGSAITEPVEGMVAYLEDTNTYEGYNGSAWIPIVTAGAWISYTPTLTNLTLGNGTLAARYALVGKALFFYFQITLGSTSAVGNGPTISFPSGMTSSFGNNTPLGSGGTSSIGGTRFLFTVYQATSSTFAPRVINAASTYAFHQDLSATIPATWTTGHTIYISGRTEIN